MGKVSLAALLPHFAASSRQFCKQLFHKPCFPLLTHRTLFVLHRSRARAREAQGQLQEALRLFAKAAKQLPEEYR